MDHARVPRQEQHDQDHARVAHQRQPAGPRHRRRRRPRAARWSTAVSGGAGAGPPPRWPPRPARPAAAHCRPHPGPHLDGRQAYDVTSYTVDVVVAGAADAAVPTRGAGVERMATSESRPETTRRIAPPPITWRTPKRSASVPPHAREAIMATDMPVLTRLITRPRKASSVSSWISVMNETMSGGNEAPLRKSTAAATGSVGGKAEGTSHRPPAITQ